MNPIARAGTVRSLFRHPVKGFTPEKMASARLAPGAPWPCDRLYAVENGPSGFDPAHPAHISKFMFTVLASIPRVALARTRFDETTHTISVQAEGFDGFESALSTQAGRSAFAGWLTHFLGETQGALKVVHADGHRFFDNPRGHVSAINLESVRDLERRLGRPVDPARFRGNVYFEGWPAWSELSLAAGGRVRLGDAEAVVVKPIERCIATHVDPGRGERDLEVVPALRRFLGHVHCGVYLQVAAAGSVEPGAAFAEIP